MNNKLSVASRIIVAFTSGALITVFFLPAWRIDLFAPQYPEGLTLNIWVNGLSGDVDIINGLNHYIGMKHITVAMFPEFKFLPFVVGFFMLLGILVAISGRIKFLLIYLALTAFGGALALLDFYRWGYDYGHNLDPKAPIQVPGLYYQPPLIGHKRLLNFDAYSFPDIGGWIVIGTSAIAFLVWFIEWYRHRTPKAKKNVVPAMAILFLFSALCSCHAKPTAFKIGTDNCSFCKMGITDTRFGGEILTKKGKTFLFDDMHCLASFIREKSVSTEDISQTVTVLFDRPNEFVEADKAFFVVSGTNKSPMGSNAAGFASQQAAADFAKTNNGILLTWPELLAQLNK
jgi:copper chaperone NosL